MNTLVEKQQNLRIGWEEAKPKSRKTLGTARHGDGGFDETKSISI